MSNDTTRLLPLNTASTWITALAALIFLGLGVRALLAPAGASAFFGVPVDSPDGLAFVRAFGARNIGLSLIALALLALDMRLGLAALFFAAALIAGLDFSIVATNAGTLRGLKHLGYVVALSGFGFWLARAR